MSTNNITYKLIPIKYVIYKLIPIDPPEEKRIATMFIPASGRYNFDLAPPPKPKNNK